MTVAIQRLLLNVGEQPDGGCRSLPWWIAIAFKLAVTHGLFTRRCWNRHSAAGLFRDQGGTPVAHGV